MVGTYNIHKPGNLNIAKTCVIIENVLIFRVEVL